MKVSRTTLWAGTCLLLFFLPGMQAAIPDQVLQQLKYQLPSFLKPQPVTWTPKTDPNTYSPLFKDWGGVASACRAVVVFEKRLGNFFIRSAFHDAGAVDVTACLKGAREPDCGGAGSSLFLSLAEMTRPENSYDNFAAIAGRAIRKIASWYDVSVCDTLTVCSAVAFNVHSKGRLSAFGVKNGRKDATFGRNLRVGCLDSLKPSPQVLPATNISLPDFDAFFTARGLTLEEGVALMGTHSLVDDQGCLVGPRRDKNCDISAGDTCQDVRMFKLENHMFHDACANTLTLGPVPPMEYRDNPIKGMIKEDFDSLTVREQCKFSSPAFREYAVGELGMIRAGKIPAQEKVETVSIDWSNKNCLKSSAVGVNVSAVCPHSTRWPYTLIDAKMGAACQGQGADPTSTAVRTHMRNFLQQSNWDSVLVPAFRKMLTSQRSWAKTAIPIFINGHECTRYVRDPVCYAQVGGTKGCSNCDIRGPNCHECCRCHNAFVSGGLYALNQTEQQELLATVNVPPTALEIPVVAIPDLGVAPEEDVMVDTEPVPNNPKPGSTLDLIPQSPYDTEGSCVVTDTPVNVRGFPSSSFPITGIFEKEFVNPKEAEEKLRSTDKYGNTIVAYEMDIVNCARDLGVGCPAGLPTQFLCYNGSIPGPTIKIADGLQSVVRFNNKIDDFSVHHDYPELCNTMNNKKGRPVSIHCHGMASLAPYDGFAVDSICQGESKDYVYPNNRPTTGWYHDHQLEITADNAHSGMAGFYLIKNNSDVGTGPDRWGMDNMEEMQLMIADKVLDSQCQMRLEKHGPHKNSHFGDINVVSGIPFPKKTLPAKTFRIRFLNAAVTRPWLLSIVDDKGEEVSSKMCQMISGDGGYRFSPVQFPSKGLFVGVAERYEAVCDFSKYAGQTLYLWNTKDQRRMKDVPFFCHSHLVMRFDVTECTGDCVNAAKFPSNPETIAPFLDRVLNKTDIDMATSRVMGENGCDRTFKFGRRNGQWVINGETWHTARVAAKDVGQNTAEVWCLESGGGWFHPIHIHLIDMYVLARFKHGQYQIEEKFEMEVPKDVVSLHPGTKVAILATWGPHRGEYMIHCHNLVHEDHEMMRTFSTNNKHSMAPMAMQRDPFQKISELAFVGSQGIMYDRYSSPLYPDAYAKPTATYGALDTTRLEGYLTLEPYRLFYPGGSEQRDMLCDNTINPWLVQSCTA